MILNVLMLTTTSHAFVKWTDRQHEAAVVALYNGNAHVTHPAGYFWKVTHDLMPSLPA